MAIYEQELTLQEKLESEEMAREYIELEELRTKDIKNIKKYFRKKKITRCGCGLLFKEFYDDMYDCNEWHWKSKICCVCAGENEYD